MPVVPNLTIEEKCNNVKSKINGKWNMNLKNRRSQYWQKIRSNKSGKAYLEFQNKNQLPKKFEIKPIKDEPEDQNEIRVNLAFYKLNSEIQLLTKREIEHEKKIQVIDDEIKAAIMNYTEEQDVIDKLINQWDSDKLKAEKICISDWDKKGKDIIVNMLNFNDETDSIPPTCENEKIINNTFMRKDSQQLNHIHDRSHFLGPRYQPKQNRSWPIMNQFRAPYNPNQPHWIQAPMRQPITKRHHTQWQSRFQTPKQTFMNNPNYQTRNY
jgi:hypothetical protein